MLWPSCAAVRQLGRVWPTGRTDVTAEMVGALKQLGFDAVLIRSCQQTHDYGRRKRVHRAAEERGGLPLITFSPGWINYMEDSIRTWLTTFRRKPPQQMMEQSSRPTT